MKAFAKIFTIVLLVSFIAACGPAATTPGPGCNSTCPLQPQPLSSPNLLLRPSLL